MPEDKLEQIIRNFVIPFAKALLEINTLDLQGKIFTKEHVKKYANNYSDEFIVMFKEKYLVRFILELKSGMCHLISINIPADVGDIFHNKQQINIEDFSKIKDHNFFIGFSDLLIKILFETTLYQLLKNKDVASRKGWENLKFLDRTILKDELSIGMDDLSRDNLKNIFVRHQFLIQIHKKYINNEKIDIDPNELMIPKHSRYNSLYFLKKAIDDKAGFFQHYSSDKIVCDNVTSANNKYYLYITDVEKND